LQHALERAAFLAEQVLARHTHVVETELGGAGTAQHHGVHATHLVGADLALHQERRQLAFAVVAIGARHHDAEVGKCAVGDPELAAVEHVVVALQVGARLDLRDIGTGARLADRCEHLALAGEQRIEETGLLVRRADCGKLGDRAVSDVQDGTQRKPGIAGLFHHHRPSELVQPHPALLL
jgi:hypothetical protein